jgi:hypothetical protein
MARRVAADTAVSGGATLASEDSSVVMTILHARAASVVDPVARGGLAFWSPFARREDALFAVVAAVRRRDAR